MAEYVENTEKSVRQATFHEKDLQREMSMRLAQVKRDLERQLRDEYSREVAELKFNLSEEKAEINRQKAEINIKAKQFKEAKSALIKETIAREAEYIEAIESLQLALSEKDAQSRIMDTYVSELLNAKMKQEERPYGRREAEAENWNSKPLEEPSAPSDFNSQKLKDLEYRAELFKSDLNEHKRESTPTFFKNVDYAEKDYQSQKRARGTIDQEQRVTYIEDTDDDEVSFEIRATNDCSIYAQSCIERELRNLRQQYIDRGEQLPNSLRESQQEREEPEKVNTEGDLFTYSTTQRRSKPQTTVNLMTSDSDRKMATSYSRKSSKPGDLGTLDEESSFDEVDEGLRCKGLLDLILLKQPLDDEKTMKMKEEKLHLLKSSIKDDLLSSRVQAMKTILTTKHVSQSAVLNEYASYFARLVQTADSLAVDLYRPYSERLDMLQALDSCPDVYAAIKKAKDCIEVFRVSKEQLIELVKLMTKRYKLRVQIEICSQEFDNLAKLSEFNRATSSLYTLLKSTNKQILTALQKKPATAGRHLGSFRGQPLIDLISIDFWEEDYLRKLEGRYKALKAHLCK